MIIYDYNHHHHLHPHHHQVGEKGRGDVGEPVIIQSDEMQEVKIFFGIINDFYP